jgi:hypothetical protein
VACKAISLCCDVDRFVDAEVGCAAQWLVDPITNGDEACAGAPRDKGQNRTDRLGAQHQHPLAE